MCDYEISYVSNREFLSTWMKLGYSITINLFGTKLLVLGIFPDLGMAIVHKS